MAHAGARAREGTPSSVIGKVGRYTVFITPSATPKTSTTPPQVPGGDLTPSSIAIHSPSPDPKSAATTQPPNSLLSPMPPPVHVPPQQFGKPASRSSNHLFGFLWGAAAQVQDAHSSLDDYAADWFSLNRSKYHWALNDYYENKNKALDKRLGKTKDLDGKGQSV